MTPLFSSWEEDLIEEERKFDVRVDGSELHEDLVQIPVPAGYQLESLPPARQASSPLFELRSSAETKEGKVTLRRTLQANFGLLPRARYPELRRVLDELRATKKDAVIFRRADAASR